MMGCGEDVRHRPGYRTPAVLWDIRSQTTSTMTRPCRVFEGVTAQALSFDRPCAGNERDHETAGTLPHARQRRKTRPCYTYERWHDLFWGRAKPCGEMPVEIELRHCTHLGGWNGRISETCQVPGARCEAVLPYEPYLDAIRRSEEFWWCGPRTWKVVLVRVLARVLVLALEGAAGRDFTLAESSAVATSSAGGRRL